MHTWITEWILEHAIALTNKTTWDEKHQQIANVQFEKKKYKYTYEFSIYCTKGREKDKTGKLHSAIILLSPRKETHSAICNCDTFDFQHLCVILYISSVIVAHPMCLYSCYELYITKEKKR